jgi:predicted GNAT family acetyltransferase
VPEINAFASARDDSTEALAALAALVAPGEVVFILQVPAIPLPPGFVVRKSAPGVQMLAERPLEAADQAETCIALGDADAPEMLALAQLTQPGPFFARTHTMGRFIGVRIGGVLAAMAGERMRFPGFTEVSGVCTHPDFRGRGLARRLSLVVAARIAQRAEQPFLHAWSSNAAAISLYGQLGFRHRAEVNVLALERVE